jgi:hypothetical protein
MRHKKNIFIFIFLLFLLFPKQSLGQDNLYYKKVLQNQTVPFDGILFTNEAFARIYTLIEPEYCDKKTKIEIDKLKNDHVAYLDIIEKTYKNQINDQDGFYKNIIKQKETQIEEKNREIKNLHDIKVNNEKIINNSKFLNKLLFFSLVGLTTYTAIDYYFENN